ncbi:MAG: VanZ family protein [Ignavibacteriaceae bacterium]|nr:VanZ family protein [Ignavibacteriaceae bacterium]
MLKYLEQHKKYLVYLPLILYWILILTLTSLPGADVPNVHISDKIEHLLAYGGLGFLLNLSLRIQNKISILKKYSALFTILIVSTYGALDELHQLFIPDRSCDILDWTADTMGVIIGVLLMSMLIWVVEKKNS